MADSQAAAHRSLLERAAERLVHGPQHTLDLAEAVLALAGNPPVASKAVFTLLGRDARFRVDAEGYWTLDRNEPSPGPSLLRGSYAVVDVETTGTGSGSADRITEIAVVHVDNGTVGPAFQSLVNPGRPIPPRIQGFTGITDRMVAEAPGFEAIADEVREWLTGRTFVAHNVQFDWGFVNHEFVRTTGEGVQLERLCTVRLGRRMVPRLRSHGLDSLAAHFSIRFESRHRAFGDAQATAILLLHLLRAAEGEGVTDLYALRRLMNPRRAAGSERR